MTENWGQGQGHDLRGHDERRHKCPRWGAKRQAATFVAEELDKNNLYWPAQAGL